MKLVAAPDKFRGTLSATEAARAMVRGAQQGGWTATERPLADGGEGTLDVFGGANQHDIVTGPLGDKVDAGWRLDGELAVIEMAEASGLTLAGGRNENNPLIATTRGTGELIARAVGAGAKRIIVGVGGSATTDGGLGAIEALDHRSFSALGITVDVACDVETRFTDSARIFGPQKGADEQDIALLTLRLQELAVRYREQFAVAVDDVPYGGAAGGLAGGLYALGARLGSGFDLIADAVHFDRTLEGTTLILTGEGRLDATSFTGKVVGGVERRAARSHLPLLVLAGDIATEATGSLHAISLVAECGADRALHDTAACLEEIVRGWLLGNSHRF